MSRIIQARNAARMDLAGADGFKQGFQNLHEPIGDVGIWNGQFETGPGSGSPPGWPEGWEIGLQHANGSVTRTTGGLAGNWCMYGGNPGLGMGGYIRSLRYIPVSAGERYYVTCVAKGSTVNAACFLNVFCYDAAKAFTNFYTLNVGDFRPGTSWYRYEREFEPVAADHYARVHINLQGDPTLTNNWVWVDDVQFSTMRMTVSPKIILTDDFLTEFAETWIWTGAFVIWANSTINLTLTEAGYIWYSFVWYTSCDNARQSAANWQIFVDGLPDSTPIDCCSPVANYYMPMCISGRSSTALGIGPHTVDLRCQVTNAADTVNGFNLQAQGYYVRQP